MAYQSDLESRVAALELRMEGVAADAEATRHLAAARDRDLADLGVKVDANRTVINAVGEQLSARITELSRRVDDLTGRVDDLTGRVDDLTGRTELGFAEMRGKLDGAAAGQQTIVDLLGRLIADS